jgi:diguanylate cyclase (GGDEF)-like protein
MPRATRPYQPSPDEIEDRSPIARIARLLPHGGALPEHVWERRHRAILFLLWAHAPSIVVFALIRGYTLDHSLVEVTPIVATAAFAGIRTARRGLRSGMAAVGLLTSSAVIVHLSGGVIEAHFHFFVMVGVLTMYQDWIPYLIAIAYVVLHHGVMGVLDPASVYNHPAAQAHPWTWAGVHGAFVLAASAAYIGAWRMNEELAAAAAKAQAEVAYLAFHDKLTGLANRALLEDVLGMSLARAQRHDLAVAVLFLDIDDFKLVNDTLGHVIGDELLVQTADRLRGITRDTDLIARQGGDEFLVLLADIKGGSERPPAGSSGAGYVVAELAAKRIQEALRAPFDLSGHQVYTSASIGLSLYPADAADAVSLLKNADTAMYWSKRSGPGGYRIFTQEDVGVPTALTLATRLRRAVEEQAWSLEYQPLVELDTGRVTGVEALLRWPDAAGGPISPAEFIPLAEEMGLIEAIGAWVIDELCRQDVVWRERGLELGLSFNLSARQLRRGKLAEKVMEPFGKHGVDPRRVVIEITESAAMADPERTQLLLHDFREHGFRIAIDDFGTGYSSLSRLRNLPADILKIDRSFIADVEVDPRAGSIVAGIVRLAEGVGMAPFAEGVETQAQRSFLIRSGCLYGQGYLFARPMPPEEIERIGRFVAPTPQDHGWPADILVDTDGDASTLTRP